jgi:hypothetical protein
MSAKPKRKAKIDHGSFLADKIEMVPIWEIAPSPENDQLYGPVDPNDPQNIRLLEDIQQHGIKEPIVTTLDNYILSGHRRYWAAQTAGLDAVPRRYDNITRLEEHGDVNPRFLAELARYNDQRVKSFDQVVHEEVVRTNPEEAYENLLEYRRQAAQVKVETGVIEGYKHRSSITEAKRPMLDAIEGILDRLRDFWPLSDRQIHYQLLNDPPLLHARKPRSRYRNDLKSYRALCELLTRARIAGVISFDAIHDPTRPVTTWDVHRSPGPFIRRELDELFKGYWRDLQASQPCHIEILGEKNTIASIIRQVAADFAIPFTLGRGYASLPPRHEMAERFRLTGKDRLLLLVMSDFDPEGEDIAHSFARSMRDDFGIEGVEFVKVALTAAQVEEMNLPRGLTAKQGSSRRKRFVQEHGEHVYELESVAPESLQAILRQMIESVLDMDLFLAEKERERHDAARLAGVRNAVHEMLKNLKLE